MSKFIEIKNGLCICKDDVESIEMVTNDGFTDNGTLVTMKSGARHESTFPYMALIQILEFERVNDEISRKEKVDLDQYARI